MAFLQDTHKKDQMTRQPAITFNPIVSSEVVTSTCLDFEGESIPFRFVDDIGNSIARARLTDDGKSEIVVNIDKYTYMHNSYMHSAIKLILLHECTHVYLGHVKLFKAHVIVKQSRVFAERNADCLAANYFMQVEGDERFNAALSDLISLKFFFLNDKRHTLLLNCAKDI